VSRLSAGLLDVDRVDSCGEVRLDLADVPVLRAVSEAIEQINGRDVRVEVDPSLVVTADPERLEQMLINLIANALRHGRPPVVIGAAAVADGVRIEVRDHGPGVRPEARDRLFTPFAGSAGLPGSTGLGLWIVDRLARAHGGAVGYEPADPGARLVLTLPRGPDEPAPSGTREDRAPDGDARENEGRGRWSVDAKATAGERRRSGTAAP
jgi:signal transduction histidine kinase